MTSEKHIRLLFWKAASKVNGLVVYGSAWLCTSRYSSDIFGCYSLGDGLRERLRSGFKLLDSHDLLCINPNSNWITDRVGVIPCEEAQGWFKFSFGRKRHSARVSIRVPVQQHVSEVLHRCVYDAIEFDVPSDGIGNWLAARLGNQWRGENWMM